MDKKTVLLGEILILSVCWKYFNVQVSLDSEIVFLEKFNFW